MKQTLYIPLATLVVLGALVFAYFSFIPRDSQASVSVTDEYMATSTAANASLGAFTGSRKLVTGPGTIGSVVITGANTGVFSLIDATTSDATQRITATSTILIASFPASTAAGTYTFDVAFKDGLYLYVDSGSMATSTITYRR